MPKFRKKPVVIEARQFETVRSNSNMSELCRWMNSEIGRDISWHNDQDEISIYTSEGTMIARPGDWIIKGVKGEFYPCKPDIFEQTYEKVEEASK